MEPFNWTKFYFIVETGSLDYQNVIENCYFKNIFLFCLGNLKWFFYGIASKTPLWNHTFFKVHTIFLWSIRNESVHCIPGILKTHYSLIIYSPLSRPRCMSLSLFCGTHMEIFTKASIICQGVIVGA